jgi:Cdc6-like AAA superfamily ATPase
MIGLLVDEFNCNHQADLDTSNQVQVYERDSEQKLIKKFINDNMSKRKAGLLYLCGHPGTGKTSTLNLVLSDLTQNIHTNLLKHTEVQLYNAMTFSDVKSFAI